jgi:hypothetical protein
MNRNSKVFFVVLLLIISSFNVLNAQQSLRIMYYNILNYPGSTAERVSYFKTTMLFVQPDILLVNELINEEGANMLLNDGLNVNGISKFQKAEFINGPDSDNLLFYNADELSLYSQSEIATELRNINEYVLFKNNPDADTIFFYLYSAHLKSSTGSTNEEKRLAEICQFRERLNSKSEIENVFFGGDLNFYKSSEPAYDTLVNSTNNALNDVLEAGNWHDNEAFASIHSQSTRTEQFGGGARGGLDDRFDFILFSDDVLDGLNGVKYTTDTYKSVGNDANHFDIAIIDAPQNTSVPDSVLQALYFMSDHLPVICDVEVDITTQLTKFEESDFNIQIFPNPANTSCKLILEGVNGKTKIILKNSIGNTLSNSNLNINSNRFETQINLANLPKGFYYLSIIANNSIQTKKIVVN